MTKREFLTQYTLLRASQTKHAGDSVSYGDAAWEKIQKLCKDEQPKRQRFREWMSDRGRGVDALSMPQFCDALIEWLEDT